MEFTRKLREEGMAIREAVALACRVRLRPILMTSLATILGMVPMALALEAGSEQYAPLARAIIGGLTVSVVITVFVVPAAYLLVHRKEETQRPPDGQEHCNRRRGNLDEIRIRSDFASATIAGATLSADADVHTITCVGCQRLRR